MNLLCRLGWHKWTSLIAHDEDCYARVERVKQEEQLEL